MSELTVHPNVYATGRSKGLVNLLERVWVREHTPGDGTMFIISGFGNYNGGVRFFETFRHHKANGGAVVAIFAGSASSRLTSKQVVAELLGCGADVHVINRKRLLHAKCYGTTSERGDSVVVTSGNFTGPGMAQNVEMSVLLDPALTANMGFAWADMLDGIRSQKWAFYRPSLAHLNSPAWKLLYDEKPSGVALRDSEEVTMLLKLGHADTVRINAAPGSSASLGSQYFWLSKDCYDFFPPLTVRNMRGHKATYSCFININYVDLNIRDPDCRVTFEAENNLDFRLGTGVLRNTGVAMTDDLAAISRIGDTNYELRVIRQGTPRYLALLPHAVHEIGHQGKRYGYIPNGEFASEMGLPFVGRARATPVPVV